MEKDLTIIIPTYNDTIEKISCTLDSIINQRKYDFSNLEIIIIDDNSTTSLIDWNEILKLYAKLNIKYLRLSQNKGPGNARQIGLDNSCGEFVYFLDLGDSLYNDLVLQTFAKKKTTFCDIISTRIFDESIKSRRLSFVFNNAYIFGIFIRREFIVNNNIRFNEFLRWEEDTYFEELLRYYNPRVISLKNTSYSYNFDSTSITRKNNHEYQNEFGGFSAMVVKSILLCDFYEKEKAYSTSINEVIRVLILCYVRFYPYLFGELNITERMHKILFLLNLLLIKSKIDTNSIEFEQLLLQKMYQRMVIYNNSVPFEMVREFINLVKNSENLDGDYLIEGTNITINELMVILGLEDNNKRVI